MVKNTCGLAAANTALAGKQVLLYIIIVQNKAKFKEFARKMSKKPVFSGIVCEFNPLHFGHEYLLQAAKKNSDALVCIMSGNWVQRGEPALLSKYARARMALACGADLVAELPLPWAMAGAERFAFGAISLLHHLGCIGQLWFGSECGSSTALESLAGLLLSEELGRVLPDYLRQGMNFALARQRAVQAIAGSEAAELLQSPNNILGIEYCKALLRLHSHIRPYTVTRVGSAHDAPGEVQSGAFLSASQLRALLLGGNSLQGLLPEACFQILQEEIDSQRAPADFSRLEGALIARLRMMERADFAALPDISEGLENRLYEVSRSALAAQQLYDGVKSKRYSHARIRRLVLSALLSIPARLPDTPPYFRVLAMNENGRELLRAAARTSTLPLAIRPRDFRNAGEEIDSLFQLEARSTDLYALCLPSPPACGWEYRQGFFFARNTI